MALELADFDDRTRDAVAFFWESRLAAGERNQLAGRADQGERGGVTGGKNLDGLAELIGELVEANGLRDAEVIVGAREVTLPGYFRPTKDWDILVLRDKRLIAAVEFKSHIGPSFGNNANNRAEEAIGTAHDFWTAHREGAFGDNPRPFVGWVILVEDAYGSRRPGVREMSRWFPAFPEFRNISYLERYDILCRRPMQERLYTEAAVIASSRDDGLEGEYSNMSDATSLFRFAAAFAGHIAAEAAT